MKPVLVAVPLVLGWTSPVFAVNLDPLLAHWWSPSGSSARAHALGGINLALRDDLSAGFTNPALLGTLARKAQGTLSTEFMTGSRIPLAGVATKLGQRWAVSAQWQESRLERQLPNLSVASGSLALRQRGLNVALALTLGNPRLFDQSADGLRLHVGGAIGLEHLTGTGSYSLDRPEAPSEHVALDSLGDLASTWRLGVAAEAGSWFRGSVMAHGGSSWRLARRASTDDLRAPAATVRLRAPLTAGVGAGVRAIETDWASLVVLGEAALVRPTISREADKIPRRVAVARLGIEGLVPLGCWSGCGGVLHARFGIEKTHGGDTRFEGIDSWQKLLYELRTPSYRPSVGAGLSGRLPLGLRGWKVPLRFDVAVGLRRPRSVVFDVSARYPTLFR